MKQLAAVLGAILAASAIAAQVSVTVSCQDSAITVSPDAGGFDAGTGVVDAGRLDSGVDAGAPDAGAPATDGGQWVMGYYVGYQISQYPISSIDWTSLTHIAFGAMTVNADGGLNTGFMDTNGTGPADALALSTAAHTHGAKALLMLGGMGNGANIASAATANLPGLVSSLLGAMDQFVYDGIDLDWEDSINWIQLVALAQSLRAARPGMLLTYPAGPINGNYQTVSPNMQILAQSLDRVFVMSYAPGTAGFGAGWSSWFNSPLTGVSPSTPVAIDDTLARYATAGVPKAKLGMGIGFFAICYPAGITAPRQTTNNLPGFINGGDNNFPLSTLYAPGGILATAPSSSVLRDSVTANPYLSFPTVNTSAGAICGQGTQYVPYEDEASILAKGAWSKANGYGGAMVWTLSQGWLPANAAGGRQPNALMQALRTGFLQ